MAAPIATNSCVAKPNTTPSFAAWPPSESSPSSCDVNVVSIILVSVGPNVGDNVGDNVGVAVGAMVITILDEYSRVRLLDSTSNVDPVDTV